MKTTWILVANAFQAQLYEREKPRDPLIALESLVHPESRLKSGELNDDQLGRTMTQSGGHTSYSPPTTNKEKEEERFAREIAERLKQGVLAERCGALMLFASPSMLGAIRGLLDGTSAKLVSHSSAIDLTAFSGRELEARLEQLLQR
jgi:protein required for attachment to host cells